MAQHTLNPADWQAAIVDLDGTMVDTLGDFDAALNLMLRELGQPPVPRSFVQRTIGKGSEHLLRRTLAEVGAGVEADPGLHDRAWTSYQHHYAAVNGRHAAIFPGVVEGLEALAARGLKLACLTNKPTAWAKALLDAKGLARFFGVVFGGDAFERKKPDPLPVIRSCEALGSLPARTLMIGDSSNDAEAARAAGCPVVLVNYGYNHGEPVDAVDADGVIASLLDLSTPRA